MARASSISCSDEGFAVATGGRTVLVARFDEIVRALSFKRDELVTDLVCVEIELADGRTIELHEEIAGFDGWVRRLEALPGAEADWRSRVIQPPFARNETVLFLRRGQGPR